MLYTEGVGANTLAEDGGHKTKFYKRYDVVDSHSVTVS